MTNGTQESKYDYHGERTNKRRKDYGTRNKI